MKLTTEALKLWPMMDHKLCLQNEHGTLQGKLRINLWFTPSCLYTYDRAGALKTWNGVAMWLLYV
jgi:hypothetical protein